jgi:hypothetical protein
MTLTAPPRQHHYHHRTSASRSRHRQELIHDKRTPNHIENVPSKHQQKQKRTTTPTSAKTSTRRHWLKGRKETPTETPTKAVKQEMPATKSSKNNKSKKKNVEHEKVESTKKSTTPIPKEKTSPSSDNNRLYGVPATAVNEQTKSESISSQPPARIEEENESDREQETPEDKNIYTSPKVEDTIQIKECVKIPAITVERRPSKKQQHQKLSSTDGEILSRVEDDTRFVH